MSGRHLAARKPATNIFRVLPLMGVLVATIRHIERSLHIVVMIMMIVHVVAMIMMMSMVVVVVVVMKLLAAGPPQHPQGDREDQQS